MANFDQIMNDHNNYALEPNSYLELVKHENDKNKRYQLLKKYFTENITKNFYQNMDLLNASHVGFEQFQNMYLMISKDLTLKLLLAINILSSEKETYDLCVDDIKTALLNHKENEMEMYSICKSYLENKN